MSEVSIDDKMMLIDELLTIRDNCWRIMSQTRSMEERRNFMIIDRDIDRIFNQYALMIRAINEYKRFKILNQNNKFDNLLSMLKIMERLDTRIKIEINLADDFDFNKFWIKINDYDGIKLSQIEYEELTNKIEDFNIKITDELINCIENMENDLNDRRYYYKTI